LRRGTTLLRAIRKRARPIHSPAISPAPDRAVLPRPRGVARRARAGRRP
jgi:hypothetical protein